MRNVKWIMLLLVTVASGLVIKEFANKKDELNFQPLSYAPIDQDLIDQNKIYYKTEIIHREGGPDERLAFELLKKRNPVTEEIPENIRRRELMFASKVDQANSKNRILSSDIEFTLRGPYNVGGRTRALHLDVNDDDIILAGGVSGGMWKSSDFGSTWVKTTALDQHSNATCIEQDIRDGHTDVWFYGTGEIRGNSAGKSGAPYRGDGIYKSTDNGDSWQLIPTTSTNGITSFNSSFKYVNRILINHLNTTEREMYAAVYGGIIRTTDDFATYEFVLGDVDYTGGRGTEIAMTSEGVFYATIGNEGGDEETGIWTSTDGINWTDITPYDDDYRADRIVMDIAPSNEDSVYFHSAGSAYRIDLYDAENDEWTDLSDNIPSFGAPVGDLAQGSYNMFINVHPLNSKVVYIGSTNVYRSTDGFTSTENTTWIGGYSNVNNVSTYENHHPDQHYLVFLSSDPNHMITSNDGGLQVTYDNLADEVEWTSLNNGYVTSQFYSAGINLQDPGDNRILGGLQDNSSWYGTSSDPNANWQDIWSGDGTFCAITYNSLYVSTQNLGSFYRYGFDEDGNQNGQSRLFPPSSNYLFVNPWVEDPVDPNRLYVAASGAVFYALDGTEFPGEGDWLTLSTGSSLPNTNVSAIGVSTNPEHVVYVGFANGQLFLMPNSSDNSLPMTEITGEDFPQGGYINSIEVDEHDANRAIVVFTNYEVLSAFLTEDGGETWTPISGNLEENADGTGAGLGINWAESIRISEDNYYYLLGTNIGLYGTDVLDGMSTVWTKLSEDVIGNSVIDMIRVRSSDGYVVVGTHGNGMFEANFDKDFELSMSKIGDLSLCEGESVKFRAARSESFTYQWFKDGSPIDGETDYQFDATTGGEFYVTASSGGESFTSRSFTTSFNGRPDATITLEGDILSVPECDNCNYSWIDGIGNPILDGANTLDITTLNVTAVRVLITNDCFTVQSEKFDLLPTGIDEIEGVSIYPNPVASNFINLRLDNLNDILSIEIFDTKGAKIDVLEPNHSEIKYDISLLQNGLFVVKVNTTGGSKSFKLIKE
jgi:photosystem II stability/assembly factor-like uncharacterized protein